MQATDVTAPDGLNLAVQEWGNPHGPEILFIHGFNQSLPVSYTHLTLPTILLV